MRYAFSILIPAALLLLLSCGNKDKKVKEPSITPNDTLSAQPVRTAATDTTLSSAQPALENELKLWAQSFTHFTIDSFHYQPESSHSYKDEEAGAPEDLKNFNTFYKASLVYSPDSSRFLDLYSANIMLEKRGKKIVAMGDADQTVMLCEVKANSWKSVAFFGPSGGIEEAAWTSPSTFILAGSMQNDEGKPEAFMILGNTTDRSLRWFGSNLVRPQSSNYEASGFAKLKIDSWD